MDFRSLCLAAICVLFFNEDNTSSKTDFSPSTLDIACEQLLVSSCPEHSKWINRCPEYINRTDGQKTMTTMAKSESAGEESGRSPAKLYPPNETVHTSDLDLIQYNTSLHQACMEGKLKVVKYILSQGLEDINCREKMGRTPVMMAAVKAHVKVFEYLVSQGCDLLAVNKYNNSVLHYACIGGSIEIVRKLVVNDRFDIDSIGHLGRRPIMYATLFGHREAFDLLVEKGCDLLVTDELKNNILHLACKRGHVDIVQYILSNTSVDKESRGQTGMTPLLVAAYNSRAKVFDGLLRNGCNVHAVDDEQNNILHLACRHSHVDMVQHILSHTPVNIESKGFNGMTPILTAAWYDKIKVFDFLILKGSDVNAVDDNKYNILHEACLCGNVEMTRHILSLKVVSIDSRAFAEMTPVLVAAWNGHTKLLDIIVEGGCNVNAVNDQRNNMLHLACMCGHVDMVQHILSHTSVSIESKGFNGMTPVLIAAWYGKIDVFDRLVKKGCKVNTVDIDKNNVLHLACINGHWDIVRSIVSSNIVSIESRGNLGRVPLLLAAQFGHRNVLDFLIRKGANVIAQDYHGNSILHAACLGGQIDMVKHLMSLRAVDGMEKLKNKRGQTPLEIAGTKVKKELGNLLKSRE